jgi:hypothetical protein
MTSKVRRLQRKATAVTPEPVSHDSTGSKRLAISSGCRLTRGDLEPPAFRHPANTAVIFHRVGQILSLRLTRDGLTIGGLGLLFGPLRPFTIRAWRRGSFVANQGPCMQGMPSTETCMVEGSAGMALIPRYRSFGGCHEF